MNCGCRCRHDTVYRSRHGDEGGSALSILWSQRDNVCPAQWPQAQEYDRGMAVANQNLSFELRKPPMGFVLFTS